MTHFAPSEECILLCDVRGCEARVSMVNGVDRRHHGWGRITVYDEPPRQDYDLCPQHYNAVLDVVL